MTTTPSPQAHFIVLEGIDGAGTTTQTALLTGRLDHLAQRSIRTREPTDGPIGVMIRQMLARRIVLPTSGADGLQEPMTRETLAALFAADRLDHVAALIEPALARGQHVVCDRYLHSSLAYQGDVEEGGVDYSWILALNSRARVPDLTCFLRIDLETSLSRIADRGAARDIYETREKLERLIVRYEEVMELCASRGDRVLTLDATLPIDTLHEQIWSAFQAL